MTNSKPKQRFRNLFELIKDPVVEFKMIDGEPIVRTLNPAFKEVFGYEPESMIGKSLNEFIVPREANNEAIRFDKRTADGKYNSGVVTRLTHDGPREFLYRGVPYERNGSEFGFAIYTDITERNERREKLRKQKQRLEEFAEIVSHDIRNPLNVAKGRARMLDSDQSEIILQNLDRIDAIIDDVLTVAWTGQPVEETESVNIRSLAGECWEHVESKNARLVIAESCSIQADFSRLKQLFENLFRNAIEHGGNDVTVTVGQYGSNGFYIADNGSGVPDADSEDVFNRGYSTTTDGTGLGLSIVRGICDAHGWSVALTESESGGARFEIEATNIEE